MLHRTGPALLIAACVNACWVQHARAQPEDERYSFSRVDEGYLRLDGRTGQVSLCTRKAVGWACQLVPDERAALEAEIARLQGENVVLKKELLAHDLPLPGVATPQSSAKPEEPQQGLHGQINKLISMMDNVWRRLVDMVWSLQREILKRT
jgi:hypothetical protein